MAEKDEHEEDGGQVRDEEERSDYDHQILSHEYRVHNYLAIETLVVFPFLVFFHARQRQDEAVHVKVADSIYVCLVNCHHPLGLFGVIAEEGQAHNVD